MRCEWYGAPCATSLRFIRGSAPITAKPLWDKHFFLFEVLNSGEIGLACINHSFAVGG
ncbi:hypothetical protein PCA20602_03333 [Pandoraea capi]|uniref:Uncharacterized protein n=1 Tax=Pandoraea capi TaxID=2508286 RepID=A0ABY6W4E8_9BURK|nr:hypothetical protein PCA20602_03333 [Pandoraea capi]